LLELSEEDLQLLKTQAGKFQFDYLNHLFSLLLKGEQEIAQSTFPRIMLEMTLIRMATLQPILPIDEMIKKLEALENCGLPQGGTERKPPSISTRVAHPVNKESEKRREGAPPRKQEEVSEEAVLKKEDLNEEESSAVSPKIWEETWRALVDFTRARNPILGSFLALGSLIHLSDEKIEIGFEKDSFHYERMLEKENRSQLESICHEYLQRKAKVVVSPLNSGMGPNGRIMFSRGVTTANGLVKQSEKQEENPIIQEALRLFNGKIVEK
jgi:DNA polymerase-3 subunit gamma/tau